MYINNVKCYIFSQRLKATNIDAVLVNCTFLPISTSKLLANESTILLAPCRIRKNQPCQATLQKGECKLNIRKKKRYQSEQQMVKGEL